MFGQRDVVIEYQRANGATFHTRQSHKHFTDAVAVVDAVHGTDLARSLPREPAVLFSLLDSFLKQVVHRESPLGVAVILPYVETLIPESSGESSAEDRAVRVFIQKWATDPSLLSANVTFVLITENLADISSRIVRSPQTVEVEVDRPDEAERLAFLEAIRPADWFASKSDLPAARLAQLTSGLTRIQLRQILSSVDERGTRLDATTAARTEEGGDRSGVLRAARVRRVAIRARHGVGPRRREAAPAPRRPGDHGRPVTRRADGLPDRRSGGIGEDVHGELLHRRDRLPVRAVPQLPLAVAGRHRRQPREDPEAAAVDVAGRRDHRRSRCVPRRSQPAGRLGHVESRLRAVVERSWPTPRTAARSSGS